MTDDTAAREAAHAAFVSAMGVLSYKRERTPLDAAIDAYLAARSDWEVVREPDDVAPGGA